MAPFLLFLLKTMTFFHALLLASHCHNNPFGTFAIAIQSLANCLQVLAPVA